MVKKLFESQGVPFKRQLILLSSLIALGIIIFLFFFYYSFSATLQKEREEQSKHLSQAAIGMLSYFYGLGEQGALSPEDAKNHALKALEAATYGDNGYFGINGGDGTLLMQPYTPDRVGINQIDWQDVKGKPIFAEFVKQAKLGGNWVDYSWPKPNSYDEFPKISYVSYFEPWDWVLGTGLYLDDMKADIRWAVIQASGFLFVGFILFISTIVFTMNYFALQLSEIAVRDTLTQLYTKRFLKEIESTLLEQHRHLYPKRTLAVAFIDIDHFKEINDTYGHDVGDLVLKQVARIMQSTTRPEDFCIRFGGDEFVILGFFKNEFSVLKAIERVRENVCKADFSSADFSSADLNIHLTISVGVALHHTDNKVLDQTLKQADIKLYQAKEGGRDRIMI